MRNKRAFALDDCEGNVMPVKQRQSAVDEQTTNLMLLLASALVCSSNFKNTSASSVIHPTGCDCSIAIYRSLTTDS